MKLSVGLRVSSSLSLTPQLQQAIRLLQLSSLELEQEIQNQLDSNPLLEAIDSSPEGQASDSLDNNVDYQSNEQQTSDYDSLSDFQDSAVSDGASSIALDEQMGLTRLGEDLPVDTQWDDVFSHQSTALASPEFDEREDTRTVSDSIWSELRWQLNLTPFSPVDRIMAECIIDGIDERGYLEASLEELLEATQNQLDALDLDIEEVELSELEVVLKRIQNFDPPGVGARDLSECLCLQLRALPEHTPSRRDALNMMAHHELLLINDIPKLMRQTNLDQDALRSALALVKSLDPYPGLKFQNNEREHQVPDVIVRKKNDHWEVQLNTDILPKLRVNSYYASMIKRADQSEENQYLRTHMQEARNFIKSVDERHKTLLKVSTCIVQHQRAFLEHGPEAMKPLILRDIALETELHESTVSRVTTQKFLLTPRGLFELKYFFSSHVATSTGGECSSTAIRAMIKKMVQEENVKKPLSDNALTEKLHEAGIDVARRTVAKYRESLNIASSSERKRLL
ncbi:RNA polymerase factor sigma-54 [Aquirhabdus parva]|uniref:RNA polymerase sigma-54 factor n=1 Tax=Aquirhabdus parva TaxID=2283318 RepID=A0A345P2P0_9GAMM|nr:RNA polymerase factor sigma-54 [Aquirhabdus parva]AXI01549.1 RNA polymerase factor sigma-54 [Aquirhabdus parva]